MGIIQIVGVSGSHPIAICLLAVVVFDFSSHYPVLMGIASNAVRMLCDFNAS
jgi:hypothetical protein